MTDIITFLRARLDEDERIAREVTDAIWYQSTLPGDQYNIAVVITRRTDLASGNDQFVAKCGIEVLENGEYNAAHIARWDPARVLAEVKTKRRITTRHSWPAQYAADLATENCPTCEVKPPCATLRILAEPYAGHPDYDQAWICT